MKTYRVLFLGTPDFAVESLKALRSDNRFEIPLVITQPDRPAGRGNKLTASEVAIFAEAKGLKVFKADSVNSPEALAMIAELKCDAAVVVAFGQILSQKFLSLFPKGAVNVHGSLLPKWRGAAPIQRSLMAGDPETGVCLQQVVKKLDAGPVIGIRKIKLVGEEEAPAVYEKLKVLGAELLTDDFSRYLEGKIEPQVQNETEVTIAPKIEKDEGLIDWKKSATEILNQYRGLSLWPGVWTFRNGKRLRMQTLKVLSTKKSKPGEVLGFQEGSLQVSCGEDSLLIGQIQPESKPFMKAEDYARGYGLKVGEILG